MARTLLLADDSVTIQRVIELTFSGEDVQVIAVSDGEQAIARMQSERPDIVLADIGMPKRDGYEVAAFVKGHKDLANIPVLLLAGAFEPVDEARAREVKSDGVLVKPFEPQQVIARVRELVDGFKTTPVSTPMPQPVDMPRPVEVPRLVEAPRAIEPVAPGPQAQAPGEGLDDYFDRLDAAFATLGAATPGASLTDPFADKDVPTVEDLIGDAALRLPVAPPMEFGRVTLPPVEPPDASPTRTPAPRAQAPAPAAAPVEGSSMAIADVFRALFAAEQQGSEVVFRAQPAPAAAAPAPVTDDLVDEVTRRVLERLAPDTARQLVADIVSEIAERLVREEIERIRNSQ